MSSNYVVVSIKLCLDFRNDEYIILPLLDFAGGCIHGQSQTTPGHKMPERKPDLNRVKKKQQQQK